MAAQNAESSGHRDLAANRWYILDHREGVSLARAMVNADLDTWCLDWGVPEDEDRYLSWDDVVARLARAIRAVRRETGADPGFRRSRTSDSPSAP